MTLSDAHTTQLQAEGFFHPAQKNCGCMIHVKTEVQEPTSIPQALNDRRSWDVTQEVANSNLVYSVHCNSPIQAGTAHCLFLFPREQMVPLPPILWNYRGNMCDRSHILKAWLSAEQVWCEIHGIPSWSTDLNPNVLCFTLFEIYYCWLQRLCRPIGLTQWFWDFYKLQLL